MLARSWAGVGEEGGGVWRVLPGRPLYPGWSVLATQSRLLTSLFASPPGCLPGLGFLLRVFYVFGPHPHDYLPSSSSSHTWKPARAPRQHRPGPASPLRSRQSYLCVDLPTRTSPCPSLCARRQSPNGLPHVRKAPGQTPGQHAHRDGHQAVPSTGCPRGGRQAGGARPACGDG